MTTVTKTLIIYNVTQKLYTQPRNLSISGDDDSNYVILPNQSISFDLIKVQFDERFLDTLTAYVANDSAEVTLDGVTQTSDDIGNLKYPGGGSSEVQTYATDFIDETVSLVDGQDFTLVEAVLQTTAGMVNSITILPSVASGQVTVEVFQDSGRLQKLFEHVIDLSDTDTYSSHKAYGFENEVAGSLYATLSCSGIAGGSTADFTIVAQATAPVEDTTVSASTLGAGLENDGTGLAQIALATSSGMTLASSVLAIIGDNTQGAYISVNTDGAYVTGAVDTSTAQSVAGEKLFDSVGLTPRGTSGVPVAGTWSVGTEVLDSDNVKYRCVTSGTPGTWELADTVTIETDVVVSSAVAVGGGTELLEIPVTGNVGSALWLRVWARRDSGTAEMSVPFRVRIYENTNLNGREVVWQSESLARQTYLDTLLPASQTYLEVNDNNVLDTDEIVCVYASDSRYEIGRSSGRSSGDISLDEALVDSSSWAVNTLVIIGTEFFSVPWFNNDGAASHQNKILLEVQNNGLVSQPSLVFYAQAKAMSLGVIR